MGYTKAQIRQALSRAREDGRDCVGLAPDLRETELQLERWGLLPIGQGADVDKRVADWYKAQGLAVADGTPAPSAPAAALPSTPSDVALTAAEAALEAARAALALARSMQPGAA